MRSFSAVIVALLGTAAADRLEWPRNNHHAYKPYPTGGHPSPTPTPSPSKSTHHPHPYPTGDSSLTPYPPHHTDTITTYTTETICPVTKTYGTQVITTLTTSTITITSCKGGCHKPTETPYPTDDITKTETLTTTTYSFVPCSTSVGHNGPSVIYSTYLTASYYPTTYTTEYVVNPTPIPLPTPVHPTTECPAQATVTVTVGPKPCKHCEVKTYTVTESGSTVTFTVTVTPTDVPTYKPHRPHPPPKSSSHGPKPPPPTGGSSSYTIPTETGSVPYPTHGPSSKPHYSSSRTGPKPTGYHVY